jgi:hypothetical protein
MQRCFLDFFYLKLVSADLPDFKEAHLDMKTLCELIFL